MVDHQMMLGLNRNSGINKAKGQNLWDGGLAVSDAPSKPCSSVLTMILSLLMERHSCFPFQEEHCQSPEADMFIKLSILKSDIKSVAFGITEKHSVNTAERARPRRWPLPKECRGMDKKLTPVQKLQNEGKSNSRRTNLFHQVWLASWGSVQPTSRSVLT